MSVGRSSNVPAIVDHLFRKRVATIPSVAALLGVAYRSARLNTAALVRAGVLREIEGTSNPKYFLASEFAM